MNRVVKQTIKKLMPLLLAFSMSFANAATGIVKERAVDNTGGRLSGGIIGFLVGGFGGPLGSLAGGVIGVFSGETAQQKSQLSGTRYLVSDDAGNARWWRSAQSFSIGERVQIDGAVLRALPVASR